MRVCVCVGVCGSILVDKARDVLCLRSPFNPFTAPSCKLMSGLKDARSCLHANSRFSGPLTSTFNAVRFDENPFTCQCEKETKRLNGFIFRTSAGHFQVTSWRITGEFGVTLKSLFT